MNVIDSFVHSDDILCKKKEEEGRKLRESNDRFRNIICETTSRSREVVEKKEEIPNAFQQYYQMWW